MFFHFAARGAAARLALLAALALLASCERSPGEVPTPGDPDRLTPKPSDPDRLTPKRKASASPDVHAPDGPPAAQASP